MKTNANIGLAMFLLTAPILLVVFNVPVIRVIRETDSIAKVTLNLNHRFQESEEAWDDNDDDDDWLIFENTKTITRRKQ